MASATKNVNQIVRLKQVMQRWKHVSLNRLSPSRSDRFDSDSDSTAPGRRGRVTPPGRLVVYAGPERRRFVIPTRYLNLPVFLSLLDRAEEEFGFQTNGGLVLPCEAEFFAGVVERETSRGTAFSGSKISLRCFPTWVLVLARKHRMVVDMGSGRCCRKPRVENFETDICAWLWSGIRVEKLFNALTYVMASQFHTSIMTFNV